MVRVMVVALMAVVGMLAGPMSSAYAGGMGIGDNVAFQCHLISGAAPGGTADLTDRFGTRTTVKLGAAQLYCTDVFSANFSGARNLTQPTPCTPGGAGACDLKCYAVKSSKADKPARVLSVSDFVFAHGSPGGEDLASIGSSELLCLGAEGITPNP